MVEKKGIVKTDQNQGALAAHHEQQHGRGSTTVCTRKCFAVHLERVRLHDQVQEALLVACDHASALRSSPV